MKRNNDMTSGTPWKQILLFAVPLFVGTIFQMLYNTVDAIVVGRFVGIKALAAVGASTSSYNLIIALVNGFCSGASVVIAQTFGGGDMKMVRNAYITTCKILLIIGVLFMGIGIMGCGSLLRLLGTPEDVFADAHTYVMLMSAGILATCLYNGMASFLRSVGNSFIPLVALIVASVLNIVLDLAFVIWAGLGVTGVAIATVLSQLISGIFCFVYINRKMPEMRFSLKEFSIQGEVAHEMVRIGIPATFSAIVVTVSTMFIQAAINSYGSTVVGAYTVGMKVENICFCLAFAIGMATGVFCGQNTGAGDEKRTIQGFWSGIAISIIYSTIVAIPTIIFTRPLISIFTNEPEIFEIATPLVRITIAFGPVLGVVFVFQHFLRNVSDVQPTVVMSFMEVLSRGILPFVFSAWVGYFGIWWATPVGWTLCMIIGILRFASGKWKGKATVSQTNQISHVDGSPGIQ